MSQPKRPFLGESAESRISARRKVLLDTAFRMAAESGWKGVSIHQLCQQAGLNKRYFYESFSDLESLGAALVDDLAEQLIAIGQAAVLSGMQQGFDTLALARHALQHSIGWLVDDPRRARMLFSMAGDNPRALQHRQDVIRKFAQTLSAFSIEYHQATEPHAIAKVGSTDSLRCRWMNWLRMWRASGWQSVTVLLSGRGNDLKRRVLQGSSLLKNQGGNGLGWAGCWYRGRTHLRLQLFDKWTFFSSLSLSWPQSWPREMHLGV